MTTWPAPGTVSRPVVLFLCTANSARSQMAEALLKKYAGDRFDVCSAGVEPTALHPLAVRVLNEIGVSTEGQRSKNLREYLGRLSVRYVIAVCRDAERACPSAWPGVLRMFNWPVDDPVTVEGTEEERLDHFRAARDEIDARIKEWLAGSP
jgi:arsenate reductase